MGCSSSLNLKIIMSKYIVLYNFSNYYNRKIKRLATFAEYKALITPGENTPALFRGFEREFRNFDFSDGVYAKHVINIAKEELQYFKVNQPDYFVVEESYVEGEGEEATTTTKVTRWYVLQSNRVRGNQYELSLRRDLLADYWSEVLDAPTFIQRGCPITYQDPAIFNKEGFTFNQIKKYEIVLNNNILTGDGGGWVVGYIAREDSPTDITNCPVKQEINIICPNYDDLPAQLKTLIANQSGFLNIPHTAKCSFPLKRLKEITERGRYIFAYNILYFNIDGGAVNGGSIGETDIGDSAMPYFYWDHSYGLAPSIGGYWSYTNILRYFNDNVDGTGTLVSAFDDYYESLDRPYDFSQDLIDRYNDTYYLKDGQYYKIHFQKSGSATITKTYIASQLLNSYDNIAYRALGVITSLYTPNDVTPKEVYQNPELQQDAFYAFNIHRILDEYTITSEKVDNTSFDVTIPKERNQLLDAPYDMFCMPLGSIDVKNITGWSNFTTYLNTSLAAARGITAKGTSSKILDIQILPYCPFKEVFARDVFTHKEYIDLSNARDKYDYTIMYKSLGGVDTPLGIILYPLHSKGSFQYNLSLTNMPYDIGLDIADYIVGRTDIMLKKVMSETSLVRIVSPNYAAVYEVNPQKNGRDGIKNLQIDYFYKPYTPYLHVKPIFNEDGVYGIEKNDPYGLICSGDFSIATASSKWEEYQVQNANFQNQFDRTIQNLDVNNSIALQQAQITGGVGIATTALSGAAAGAIAGAAGAAGGPVGAIVGGAVGLIGGAAASTVGYVMDLQNLKKQQSEARGFATDMYTYQLGNVKALPNTLNKVSSFTPNNKIFPFIEIYTCTDEEKEALRNKIKYNGMTIMRIGNIRDYINAEVTYYVQGELIRLEGIDESSNVVAEIANEIKEGAYYYGSDTSES